MHRLWWQMMLSMEWWQEQPWRFVIITISLLFDNIYKCMYSFTHNSDEKEGRRQMRYVRRRENGSVVTTWHNNMDSRSVMRWGDPFPYLRPSNETDGEEWERGKVRFCLGEREKWGLRMRWKERGRVSVLVQAPARQK